MKKIGWSTTILSCTLFTGAVIATAAFSDESSRGTQGLEATRKPDSTNRGFAPTNRALKPLLASPARTANVVEVSAGNFDRYVLNSSLPVLVDFYAHWCGPCQLQAPILEKAASEIDNAKFVKINVDENGQLAAAYGVNSIPTLLVFKNGKLVARHTGLAGDERIKALLSDSSSI